MHTVQTYNHTNFHILTGGPGVGKTTLLEELKRRGYPSIPEAARDIIRDQMNTGGEALPWKDREAYTMLMLERSVQDYITASANFRSGSILDDGRHPGGSVFFDRGIADSLSYAKIIGMTITREMRDQVARYAYNRAIFLLPPWQEIYRTDEERKQTWKEAVYTYGMLKTTYEEYGYTIIEVPKDTVEKRADFILQNI